jgi:hypothetical protein
VGLTAPHHKKISLLRNEWAITLKAESLRNGTGGIFTLISLIQELSLINKPLNITYIQMA